MNVLTEPVTKQLRPGEPPRTATQWLDALATGTCDQNAFLKGVGEALQRAPDMGWELLALLDQYYRRGKITAEAFSHLKGHLQGVLMGKGRGGEVSVPLPRLADRAPSTAAWSPAMEPSSPVAGEPAPTAASTVEVPAAVTRARQIPEPAPGPAPARAATAARAARSARISVSAPVPRAARNSGLGPGAKAARGAASTPVATPARTELPKSGVLAAAPAELEAGAADPVRSGSERLLAPGDVLRDRYRVEALLGQGGMGTVFEATDLYRLDPASGDQRVAIKVLHTAVIQRPELFAELRREFQHLQSLSHPNIVRVHEFDRDGDTAFFTMEYLSGTLLSRVLFAHESSPLDPAYALAIVRDVGAAVSHAHARGVVHGDLNPGNIFVTDNGDVRVLDFGASHQLRRGPWISEFEGPQQITVATPSYASCQLLEGEAADARDDVYALACVTYALLTGNQPFGQCSALKARTLRLKPDRPRSLSRRQWQALRDGLEFARERRPADMQAWLDRFDFSGAAAHLPVLPRLLVAAPRPRHGMRWAVNGALVALIVACAAWAATHVDSLARAGTAIGAGVHSMIAGVAGRWPDAARENGEAPSSPAPVPDTEGVPAAAPPGPQDAAPAHDAAPLRSAAAAARTAMRVAPAAAAGAGTAAPAGAAADAAAVASAPPGNSLHARVELASDTVDVAPAEAIAHVIVRRSRSLRGDVTFNWWTESGTAKPGRDFVPVAAHADQIADGKSSADLMIPIVVDPARHEPRSFYVVIDEPSDNATLGARTLTMVTIPGAE